MGRALRSLLLLATLSFWLGSASAFCVAEVAYEYVMRGSDPAPERTLPCCAAVVPVAAGPQGERRLAGDPLASSTRPRAALEAEVACAVPGIAASPLRWRPYCGRSTRLLL